MPGRTHAIAVLCLLVTIVSCAKESPAPGNGAATARGRAYYSSICAKCHGSLGQGLGHSFPPLAGSEWVSGDEETLIRIVLYGLQGSIEVRGESFRGLMTGFARQLGDEDVAAILTYIRSSWGNDAGPVDSSAVARVRGMPNAGYPVRAEELSSGSRD